MTPAALGSPTGQRPAGRPFGLMGLVLSSILILLAAGLVCALLAAMAFGIMTLVHGVAGTLGLMRTFNPSKPDDPDFVKLNIVVGLVLYAVAALVVLAAARLRGGDGWRDLVAWRPWHPLRGTGLFWLLLAVTIAYSIGADQLVTYLHPEARNWVPSPKGAVWDVSFVIMTSLLAPMTEELIFRGWIYTSLRGSIGIVAAVIVSSVLFATAHWESTHLYALAILPVGLALAAVREKTGSIAASIAFHALYNGFASVALLMGT